MKNRNGMQLFVVVKSRDQQLLVTGCWAVKVVLFINILIYVTNLRVSCSLGATMVCILWFSVSSMVIPQVCKKRNRTLSVSPPETET